MEAFRRGNYHVTCHLGWIMKERGLSINWLSTETGIPRSSIADYYRGKIYPPADKCAVICTALGLKFEDIWEVIV